MNVKTEEVLATNEKDIAFKFLNEQLAEMQKNGFLNDNQVTGILMIISNESGLAKLEDSPMTAKTFKIQDEG